WCSGRNCLARPEPIFQGKIGGSPLHMPKIGPWRRKKPLISREKLGVDALNNYAPVSSHADITPCIISHRDLARDTCSRRRPLESYSRRAAWTSSRPATSLIIHRRPEGFRSPCYRPPMDPGGGYRVRSGCRRGS